MFLSSLPLLKKMRLMHSLKRGVEEGSKSGSGSLPPHGEEGVRGWGSLQFFTPHQAIAPKGRRLRDRIFTGMDTDPVKSAISNACVLLRPLKTLHVARSHPIKCLSLSNFHYLIMRSFYDLSR